MDTEIEDAFLTRQQVGKSLKVSPNRVDTLVEQGTLPEPFDFGTKKKREPRWLRADIRNWLNGLVHRRNLKYAEGVPEDASR